MSTHTRTQRTTVPQLVAMKGQQKIVSLTAYSSTIAKLIDPLVDFILVGDSTAMVGHGRLWPAFNLEHAARRNHRPHSRGGR